VNRNYGFLEVFSLLQKAKSRMQFFLHRNQEKKRTRLNRGVTHLRG